MIQYAIEAIFYKPVLDYMFNRIGFLDMLLKMTIRYTIIFGLCAIAIFYLLASDPTWSKQSYDAPNPNDERNQRIKEADARYQANLKREYPNGDYSSMTGADKARLSK